MRVLAPVSITVATELALRRMPIFFPAFGTRAFFREWAHRGVCVCASVAYHVLACHSVSTVIVVVEVTPLRVLDPIIVESADTPTDTRDVGVGEGMQMGTRMIEPLLT